MFADRRRRMVDAAVRLFERTPYADVHMEAIADCANVAKPTLYRYFPTKEALFIEALESALAELRREVQAARSEPTAGEERLRRVVMLMLDRVGRLAPAIRAVESQSSELGEQSRRVVRKGFRDLRDEIGRLLSDGIAGGEFARVDTDLAVLIVLGGIRMAAQTRADEAKSSAQDQGFDRNALAETLADAVSTIFLQGLRVRDPMKAPASDLTCGALS